jgi:hypothetical protein
VPVAHAAHDLAYAGPVLAALIVVAVLTWRSAGRARREGPASMRDDEPPSRARSESVAPGARQSAAPSSQALRQERR